MTVSPHPDFIRSGQIAARILRDVAKEVRPGVKVLRVCTLAERKIVELGAKPAFPCNVSINNEAAHYTSPHGDIRVFPDSGLVKVDLGANVNGHLSDTATTVDLDGSYEKFIVAARKALDAAIEIVRPGTRLGEIGAAIEQAIKSEGLRPVQLGQVQGLRRVPRRGGADRGDRHPRGQGRVRELQPIARGDRG